MKVSDDEQIDTTFEQALHLLGEKVYGLIESDRPPRLQADAQGPDGATDESVVVYRPASQLGPFAVDIAYFFPSPYGSSRGRLAPNVRATASAPPKKSAVRLLDDIRTGQVQFLIASIEVRKHPGDSSSVPLPPVEQNHPFGPAGPEIDFFRP